MRSGAKPLFFWHISVLFHWWCTLDSKIEGIWVSCTDSSQCYACLKWWGVRDCSWGNPHVWGKLLLTYMWACKGELRSNVDVQRWKSVAEQSKDLSSVPLYPPPVHSNAHESSLYQFRPVAEAHAAPLQPLLIPSLLRQTWEALCHCLWVSHQAWFEPSEFRRFVIAKWRSCWYCLYVTELHRSD